MIDYEKWNCRQSWPKSPICERSIKASYDCFLCILLLWASPVLSFPFRLVLSQEVVLTFHSFYYIEISCENMIIMITFESTCATFTCMYYVTLVFFSKFRVNSSQIVKISDFGLSRDIHAKDYYRAQDSADRPLPVKWMAPESLHSGIFSAKSDIVRPFQKPL